MQGAGGDGDEEMAADDGETGDAAGEGGEGEAAGADDGVRKMRVAVIFGYIGSRFQGLQR
jgi:hypothetical protein